jgi:acetyltransferase-like isoleucine patch superfamily enzyme
VGKSFLRRALNRILGMLARFLPGATSIRPAIHKLRGVKIKGRIFIGDDVYVENEYPEQVEIDDGAQIALRCTIIAHTRGFGRVIIEKNVFIGSNCVITAPAGRTLRIGEGSVVAAGSVISADVPRGALVGVERPKPIARVTVPLTMQTNYEDFVIGLRPWNKPR